MSRMLLVGLSLTTSAHDYGPLMALLKSYTWWNYLPSTWILHCDETHTSLAAKIKPLLSIGTDEFLVVELQAGNRQGWLPEKAWKWFKDLGH